jgi:hypothetical protein
MCISDSADTPHENHQIYDAKSLDRDNEVPVVLSRVLCMEIERDERLLATLLLHALLKCYPPGVG